MNKIYAVILLLIGVSSCTNSFIGEAVYTDIYTSSIVSVKCDDLETSFSEVYKKKIDNNFWIKFHKELKTLNEKNIGENIVIDSRLKGSVKIDKDSVLTFCASPTLISLNGEIYFMNKNVLSFIESNFRTKH